MTYKRIPFGDLTDADAAVLYKAFDEIRNPADWKESIDAIVPADSLSLYEDACEFMTSTALSVVEVLHYGKMLRVRADGYRAGPAGP